MTPETTFQEVGNTPPIADTTGNTAEETHPFGGESYPDADLSSDGNTDQSGNTGDGATNQPGTTDTGITLTADSVIPASVPESGTTLDPVLPDDGDITPMSVKVTRGTKRSIAAKSDAEGVSPHAYAYDLLTNHLAYKDALRLVKGHTIVGGATSDSRHQVLQLEARAINLERELTELRKQHKAIASELVEEQEANSFQAGTIRTLTERLRELDGQVGNTTQSEAPAEVIPPVDPGHTESDSEELIALREVIADLQQANILLKQENGEKEAEIEAYDKRLGELLNMLSSPGVAKSTTAAVKEAKDKYFKIVGDLCKFASTSDTGLIRKTEAYYVAEAQRLYKLYFGPPTPATPQ